MSGSKDRQYKAQNKKNKKTNKFMPSGVLEYILRFLDRLYCTIFCLLCSVLSIIVCLFGLCHLCIGLSVFRVTVSDLHLCHLQTFRGFKSLYFLFCCVDQLQFWIHIKYDIHVNELITMLLWSTFKEVLSSNKAGLSNLRIFYFKLWWPSWI